MATDARDRKLDEQAAKLTRFITSFRHADISHRIRASVLESAATLEYAINEALAAALSRDIAASDELTLNVLTRLPIDVRLSMLERRMVETGADDQWPLLVPVLRKLYNVRNRYAHGYVQTGPAGSVRITSWNRGKATIKEYDTEELAWLAYEGHLAGIALARLWAFWVPADPQWHETTSADDDASKPS